MSFGAEELENKIIRETVFSLYGSIKSYMGLGSGASQGRSLTSSEGAILAEYFDGITFSVKTSRFLGSSNTYFLSGELSVKKSINNYQDLHNFLLTLVSRLDGCQSQIAELIRTGTLPTLESKKSEIDAAFLQDHTLLIKQNRKLAAKLQSSASQNKSIEEDRDRALAQLEALKEEYAHREALFAKEVEALKQGERQLTTAVVSSAQATKATIETASFQTASEYTQETALTKERMVGLLNAMLEVYTPIKAKVSVIASSLSDFFGFCEQAEGLLKSVKSDVSEKAAQMFIEKSAAIQSQSRNQVIQNSTHVNQNRHTQLLKAIEQVEELVSNYQSHVQRQWFFGFSFFGLKRLGRKKHELLTQFKNTLQNLKSHIDQTGVSETIQSIESELSTLRTQYAGYLNSGRHYRNTLEAIAKPLAIVSSWSDSGSVEEKSEEMTEQEQTALQEAFLQAMDTSVLSSAITGLQPQIQSAQSNIEGLQEDNEAVYQAAGRCISESKSSDMINQSGTASAASPASPQRLLGFEGMSVASPVRDAQMLVYQTPTRQPAIEGGSSNA